MWYYLFLTCWLIINKSKHNKMWDYLFDKANHWRNVIYMILITFVFRDNKYLWRLQDSKRKSHFSYNYILKERNVTYLPSHFHHIHFIYQSSSIHFMYQLIHFIIPFHIIHLTDHGPSHSHSPYLILLIPHLISTTLRLSFF